MDSSGLLAWKVSNYDTKRGRIKMDTSSENNSSIDWLRAAVCLTALSLSRSELSKVFHSTLHHFFLNIYNHHWFIGTYGTRGKFEGGKSVRQRSGNSVEEIVCVWRISQ